MRLASLARKIKVTPSKIKDFALAQGIDLESGSNTKLTDDQIHLILESFDAELPVEPEIAQEPIEEETIENHTIESVGKQEDLVSEEVPETDSTPAPSAESTDKVEETKADMNIIDDIAALDPDILHTDFEKEAVTSEASMLTEADKYNEITDAKLVDEDANPESVEEVEVIKPPKIQLQGLTVKGKIDLPEPKPKTENKDEAKDRKEEPKAGPDGIVYTQGPKRERPKRRNGNKKRRSKAKHPDYNPVEAERKKKAREEEKEKQRKLKAQKKAKAKHYEENIAKKHKSKGGKKTKSAAEITASRPDTATVSTPPKQNGTSSPTKKKGALAKFWKWMNT